MSRVNTTEDSSYSSKIMLATRSTSNTQTFLQTCVLDADHKALEEHLVSNPVQQSDLDRCLLRGLQIVQQKERELSHVAPALTLVLQSGAKWNSDFLFEEQKTPYHIICESPGDHHELLDLMIKSSQQIIIDTQDSSRCTAVVYAVQNANINCLKCLISNRADVNIECYSYLRKRSAIMKVISNMGSHIKYRSVNEDIFDLLLDKSPIESYTLLTKFAIYDKSVYCLKKLIEKGARLDITDYANRYLWSRIATLGNVVLLKCMFNRGFDKDTTDQNGLCVLWYVVNSGNVEAVRYLLDLGAVIPTCTPEVLETQCEQCKENTLIVNDIEWDNPEHKDPCMLAICDDSLEIVKLFIEYGSQSCISFNALRRAVFYCNVDVTKCLLNYYKYPLNIEYTKQSDPSRSIYALLTEPRFEPGCMSSPYITKLLLDHGADPAKQMCSATNVDAVMSALAIRNLEVIAQYIRSGVDVNFMLLTRSFKLYPNVLPFGATVLHGCHNVAEMLLISGCSRGVFSLNNKFKNSLDPEVVKLMKKWKVQENKVTSLKLRCRSVILNHLSPRADIKIKKLPLPKLIIKFLSIPEIDASVEAQK